MPENQENQVVMLEPNTMPRREFIQKSLVASGGAFMGMAVGSKMTLPELRKRKPQNAASNRRKGNNGVGNGLDPQPPGNPPINDGPGTSPGDPGNKKKLGGGSLGGNRLKNFGK